MKILRIAIKIVRNAHPLEYSVGIFCLKKIKIKVKVNEQVYEKKKVIG